MEDPPIEELSLDGDLLGRTFRNVTVQPDDQRGGLVATVELLRQQGADPSSARPEDCDRVTIHIYGAEMFKIRDREFSPLLAVDGQTLREAPTWRELSRAVRTLVPRILEKVELPEMEPSAKTTVKPRR